MSTTDQSQKIPLELADEIGSSLCELLAPACEIVTVVGSVRRRRPAVSDIELLCRPKFRGAAGRLWDTGEQVNELEQLLPTLWEQDKLEPHRTQVAYGPRYKRLWWGGRVSIDLFIQLPPASWGCLTAIRTGPWDFSKILVTPRDACGALPPTFRQHDGCLWTAPYLDDPETRRPTPSEEDYFSCLRLPCWPPHERTAAKLAEYLACERSRQHHARFVPETR